MSELAQAAKKLSAIAAKHGIPISASWGTVQVEVMPSPKRGAIVAELTTAAQPLRLTGFSFDAEDRFRIQWCGHKGDTNV